MTLIPESTVTAADVAARFNLAATEGERVLELALTELGRATETVWRPVPAPTWDDWIIRVCGAIVAAKKTPTASSKASTRADQGAARPSTRGYVGFLADELALYTSWAIG